MKKNITINLYGQLYAIDEDAYQLLEQYIDNMKRYFGKREGGEEIADDIEHRVAELFSEMKSNGVEAISIEMVQDIIERIGNPEDMESDSASEETGKACGSSEESGAAATAAEPNMQERAKGWFSRRRFYRNPEDKMLGGVLSGLAAYCGSNDPLPWRIIFVLLCIFTYSAFIILYLLAWAIAPEARTAEEKLLMRGKPVNPDTINEEMMRENNLGTQAPEESKKRVRSILNGCLTVLAVCLKIILFLLAVAAVVTLIVFVVLLSYITACAMSGMTSETNAFHQMISAFMVDPTVMWQYIASMGLALVSAGIFLYATTRWLFHRNDTNRLSGLTALSLTLTAIVSLTVAITLCCVATQRAENSYTEFMTKKNYVGGYYMDQSDRAMLSNKGWKVFKYVGCNDDMSLI